MALNESDMYLMPNTEPRNVRVNHLYRSLERDYIVLDADGFDRLEPCLITLEVNIVLNNKQTLLPDKFALVFHNKINGFKLVI